MVSRIQIKTPASPNLEHIQHQVDASLTNHALEGIFPSEDTRRHLEKLKKGDISPAQLLTKLTAKYRK